MPLLLITRLDGIMAFKRGLPLHPYPKASGAQLALPRLPAWDRNLNRFPFWQLAISGCLRIALL